MAGSLLGNAVRRIEDPDLVRGRGTFVDNMRPDGVLFAAFVRTPVRARDASPAIDTSEAVAAPGVVAVYTAADLALKPGFPFFPTNPLCARPPLADGKVRFVGEAVAVVVAETKAQAVDATELVDVDYEPLDVAIDMESGDRARARRCSSTTSPATSRPANAPPSRTPWPARPTSSASASRTSASPWRRWRATPCSSPRAAPTSRTT